MSIFHYSHRVISFANEPQAGEEYQDEDQDKAEQPTNAFLGCHSNVFTAVAAKPSNSSRSEFSFFLSFSSFGPKRAETVQTNLVACVFQI